MKMSDQAVCEPYVSSSVTESDENMFPPQEYKAYPSYHMDPPPPPPPPPQTHHQQQQPHPHHQAYLTEEAVVSDREAKPPHPSTVGGDISTCSSYSGQATWQHQQQQQQRQQQQQEVVRENYIVPEVGTGEHHHYDVKPRMGIKLENVVVEGEQHHQRFQQQQHHHRQEQHHHPQQQQQPQPQQQQQQQSRHPAEPQEPQNERRTGVIRCVDTSMPPPDGVCYDPRSRRPSGGFVRPIDGLRPGDIFKSPHSGRYKEVRRPSLDPPPPPPPPPISPQQSSTTRPDHSGGTGDIGHGRGSTQCPPPPLPPSPSSSSATPASTGRVKATGKKERKKEDIEDVSSSIPDLEFDGTTVLCRVCGDKASGFHYGVHSCEGCKGFFRRSIQQKIQYRPCTKNQQCAILRINRNRCQYCRLKKCIAVGMSRDAVRFGRVPKREKAKILAAMQSVNARSQEKAVLAELEDDSRVIAAIIRAHMDTCEFTRDKVAPMLQQARAHPSYTQCPPTLACPLNPRPVSLHGQQEMVQDFSERFSPAIRGVVEFAKRLPGFQQLPQEDQVTLLKAGVFEVLLVRLAAMFDARTNTMLCLNGQLLRREALHTSVNARFLMDSMFDFAERVNCMSLNDNELALFCAVVILAPDRPGLRNAELVERVQRRLVNCLQAVVGKHHPERPNLHQELLCKIPDLRTLNTLHSEKLLKYKMTEHTAAANGAWDDRCSWNLEQDSSIGSPSSSCAADEAMRSPVSCSDSVMGETGSSAESLCGSEVSGYSELRPPFPLSRRRHDLSEGASSGDEAIESPLKCPFIKRKSESPDDSGIESGTDRSDKLSSPSVCSSPRSSIDEKSEEDREEDMPVLRRALQAPPIINTDLLIEEVYKPHKKFRALRREDEPHSSQPTPSILAQTLSQPLNHQNPVTVSSQSNVSSSHSTLAANLASTLATSLTTVEHNKLAAKHSTLARTLLHRSKTTEDHMRRADYLHSMIMQGQGQGQGQSLESPREQLSASSSTSNNNNNNNSRVSPAPYHVPQAALDRLQPPVSSWSCPSRSSPSISNASTSCSSNLSPMQPTVTAQPRLHLLTTPTPSRYYEPRVSVTPVGLGAQPSSSPGVQISSSQSVSVTPVGLGMGAQPQRTSMSPVVELQVDIADSQPLNLSKKTPPPTPQEFVLEA